MIDQVEIDLQRTKQCNHIHGASMSQGVPIGSMASRALRRRERRRSKSDTQKCRMRSSLGSPRTVDPAQRFVTYHLRRGVGLAVEMSARPPDSRSDISGGSVGFVDAMRNPPV